MEHQQQAGNAAPPPAAAAAEVQEERCTLVALPPFEGDRPALWFGHLDAVFEANRIRSSRSQFWQAAAKIPAMYGDAFLDIQRTANTAEDPYGDLKERLTSSFGMSREDKMLAYLTASQGCDKPSFLLDRMLALEPATVREITLALYMRALPDYISQALSTVKYETTAELKTLCNDLWHKRNAAAAAHAAIARPASPGRADGRGRSPSRDGARRGSGRPRRRAQTPGRDAEYPDENGLCYYHATYASRARNCRQPCSFAKGNGQAGGGN